MQTAARTYLWLVIALVIWSIPTSAQEQKTKSGQVNESNLPPVEVWNLLRSDLSVVKKFEDLPEDVQAVLAPAFHQTVNPRCADCVGRHLIFAGISSDGCFVYYSAIGIATLYEIVVFGAKARPVWAARGVSARDLQELTSRIAEGRFHSYSIR
jgi:hypothetical protein